jgi:hypothetical protein
MLTLLLWACAPSDTPPLDDPPDAAADPPVGATLGLLADPHVTADDDHADRLRRAVAWLADRDDLDAVVVLGDVAWGDGPPVARAILDGLPTGWVAFTGDNEIQVGDERTSWDTFADVRPGPPVTAFVYGDAPTRLAEPAQDAWLQNQAFTVGDVRVVCLDWASRLVHPLLGELAWLHDVPGGTLPFLVDQLAEAPGDVVLLSHHPMLNFPGGFDAADWATLADAVAPWSDRVVATAAGHLHAHADADAGPWPVHVLDATWDDEVAVSVLTLDGAGGYTLDRAELP